MNVGLTDDPLEEGSVCEWCIKGINYEIYLVVTIKNNRARLYVVDASNPLRCNTFVSSHVNWFSGNRYVKRIA